MGLTTTHVGLSGCLDAKADLRNDLANNIIKLPEVWNFREVDFFA
jgi:hypothetical protein